MEVNIQHKKPNQAYLCGSFKSFNTGDLEMPDLYSRTLLRLSVSLGFPEAKHVMDGYLQSLSNCCQTLSSFQCQRNGEDNMKGK